MGSTAFARHYLRYRFLFLFLRLLRCFTSAGLAFISLCIQLMTMMYYHHQVTPFGYPRVLAHLQLSEAFRSLLRPSSPVSTKAFTISPWVPYTGKTPVTRISKIFVKLPSLPATARFRALRILLFLCMLDSYVICVSALHLEIVISHKIVGVPILRLVSI